MSRSILYLVIGMVILLAGITPVQAFTAKSLDIAVQENGDAIVTFDYTLNFMENAAVFTRIADPGAELKKAIAANYKADVDVIGTSSSQVTVRVHGLATSSTKDGIVTMTTPALSFQSAERILKQYWFAPLINVDFSPELTRVVFPDGYIAEYSNQIAIPRISHALNR
jgi:hypothetical protein